jgi:NAD(P)-dependent dehydrogenase (short-subunit alcohol dehydrogenase family)
MIARRRGRIINLASGAGLGPIPGFTAYCTSKAALIRLSEILALETQSSGIAVFAIDPGTVRTPMNDHFVSDPLISQRAPGAQAWMRQLFADGNDAPIERSVNLVLRLASGEADALSGCMISIEDDLGDMVRRAEAVKRDELYVLRRRGLT